MNRCLVIANQTLGGKQLMSVIQDRVDGGTREFVVVAPLTPPEDYAPTWALQGDPGLMGPMLEPESAGAVAAADRAHEVTERRLELVLGRVRAAGGHAEGHVGDPDPLVAAQAALEQARFSEILLSTLPASVSRWLGMDLPSRLRRVTAVRVTTIESSEGHPLLAPRPPEGGRSAEQTDDLDPAEPRERGVAEREPEAMQVEGARLLANEARPRLRARGFEDEQIRRWAEAFIAEEGSGSVERFVGWIRDREVEHARRIG